MEGKRPWDGIEKSASEASRATEELGRGEEGGAWRQEVPSWARSHLPG